MYHPLTGKLKNKEEKMTDISEKITIKLRIGNQIESINVERNKEIYYRNASKLINDKLNLYSTRYPNQSNEKYMSMVLLDITVNLMKNEMQNDTKPFIDCLKKLTTEIEDTL
jgi:hypothetical protein